MRSRISLIAATAVDAADGRRHTSPRAIRRASRRRPATEVDQRARDRTERRALRRGSTGRDDLRARPIEAAKASTPGTKAIDNLRPARSPRRSAPRRREITISDLKVDPKSHNSFVAVTRWIGPNAQAALLRVDGAGKIDVVQLEGVGFSSLTLPNPADASPNGGRSNRSQSITNIQYLNGRLYVAGSLSNEEFASKLWAVGYPFKDADRGTSVEIFHGSHGQLETRSPVYALPADDGERRAGSDRRVPVHAARALPRLVARQRPEGARHDHRRALGAGETGRST